MTVPFLHEDEVQAAYDAAEMVIQRLVKEEVILLFELNSNSTDYSKTIRSVARAVADAVMRTQTFESGDITDLPGVTAEIVRLGEGEGERRNGKIGNG